MPDSSITGPATHNGLENNCPDVAAVAPSGGCQYTELPGWRFGANPAEWVALFPADQRVTLYYTAESTCSYDRKFGFSGGGGWLELVVPGASHTGPQVIHEVQTRGNFDYVFTIRTPKDLTATPPEQGGIGTEACTVSFTKTRICQTHDPAAPPSTPPPREPPISPPPVVPPPSQPASPLTPPPPHTPPPPDTPSPSPSQPRTDESPQETDPVAGGLLAVLSIMGLLCACFVLCVICGGGVREERKCKQEPLYDPKDPDKRIGWTLHCEEDDKPKKNASSAATPARNFFKFPDGQIPSSSRAHERESLMSGF